MIFKSSPASGGGEDYRSVVSIEMQKSVICALGQLSRADVVEALNGSAPFVRVIGDAARVSTITNAICWGYHAALDI